MDSSRNACDPATFGVDQKDVLDESYRKAGKMDAKRFATLFSPTDLGIVDIITEHLLRGRVPDKSISIELYKLNIYGPGGFFKAHVDTPRSDTMFASLVVVLPTIHEGGSLILRHNGKEWTFDSAKAVVNAQPDTDITTPQAAFVAFFSDVEHEVTTVSSGYRVTLTYNLYLKAKKTLKPATILNMYEKTDMELKNALDRLSKNESFFPDGGHLGFGLIHKYPFNQTSTELGDLEKCLKGTDAAIKRACESSSFSTHLKTVYRDENDSSRATLFDHFVNFEHQEIEEMASHLQNEGGFVVSSKNSTRSRRSSVDSSPIVWVKPLSMANVFSSAYIRYGNEASLDWFYGDLCLLAKVPPAKERNKQK